MGLDGENNTALTHRITACPCRTHASAQTDRHTHIGEGDGSGQTAEGLVAQGAYDSCADEYVCNTHTHTHTCMCARVCTSIYAHMYIHTFSNGNRFHDSRERSREQLSHENAIHVCAPRNLTPTHIHSKHPRD